MGCVPAALKTGSSLNVAHGSSLCEMRPATRYHLCGSEELQSIDMKRTKDIAKIATPRSVVHPVSPDERAEARSCATRFPRKHQGEWNEVNRAAKSDRFSAKSDAGRIEWPDSAIAFCRLSRAAPTMPKLL